MEVIEMKPCKSSQVKAHGYDQASQTMRLQFTTGALYEYYGVPQETYDALAEAESVGKFLNANIKGKFEYKFLDSGGAQT